MVDLIALVLQDDKTSPEDKVKLIDEIRKTNPGSSDRWAYRWSVWLMGGSIVFCIIGITTLAFAKLEVPPGLLVVASGIVGALAGLISPGQR